MAKFLLNVGAEKSGTTWLHNYFRNHPQYHDIGKELNILQRNDLVPTHCNYASYKSNIEHFFRDVSQLNKVTGDYTHYEGSTENIFRIYKEGFLKYDIEVVPVYIMREPINRAWSSWHMLHEAAEFHDLQYSDITSFNMPGPAAFIIHSFLQCKYKETVEALDAVFSRPLYFFYEDFFKQESLNTICDALDIEQIPGYFTEKVNASKYVSDVPIEFINMFGITVKNKRAIEFLKERFGDVPWDLSRYERK
jgi:hypothetical protein